MISTPRPQRGHMIDAKQNNHILALTSEEENFITELGMLARAQYERAPIFDTLQKTHWTERFIELNTLELREMCRALELSTKKETKGKMIELLVNHYREKVN